jgi:hypothetical protein
MKLLGLSLMLLVPAAANAAIALQDSGALRELRQLGDAQPQDGGSERLKAQGGLGFTVQTLEPVGYVAADGKTEPVTEDPPAQQPAPHSGSYIFEGKTPIKGVTIYTPKDDPNGTGRTEKPKPQGPVSNKLVYGALGLGAAATIAGLFFTPLLFLGGLLLGAGAVLFYINKKFAK